MTGLARYNPLVPDIINVYCDESCHLENDHQSLMVLGAVWCPLEHVSRISKTLREVKMRYGLSPAFELKWTKVSPARESMYRECLDCFFDEREVHFRALIASKAALHHDDFQQTHDDWYYKMYFDMLKALLSPQACYRVYLDVKDTRGAAKVAKLHGVLSNNLYDFSRSIVERVQLVRSHETEMIQLADLLVGAVSYANREGRGNGGKETFVERMRERSGYSLTRTTC